MPEKIDELFYLAKKNPKDYFNYNKLNESCRYFYEDGTSIVAHANTTDFAKEVYEKTTVPLIASGGAGNIEDIISNYKVTHSIISNVGRIDDSIINLSLIHI